MGLGGIRARVRAGFGEFLGGAKKGIADGNGSFGEEGHPASELRWDSRGRQ